MADGKVKIDIVADDSDAKKKLEDVEDAAQETTDSLDDLGDSAGKGGKGLGALDIAAGNLVANGISALLGGLKDAVVGLMNLAEETREYREDMAKLETAFKTAGHDAESASKVYEDFYAILGESDRSVEAVNHLAELTDNTADLSKWSTIAAGVTAKFGDSLPIEGLTEAANETAKVGQTTGVLADALNWASKDSAVFKTALGGNQKAMAAFNKALKDGENVEDAFTAALSKMSTEQERSAAITNTLNGLYADAAAEYNALTASQQAARRATAEIEAAQARLGAVMEPLNTVITEVKASFFSWAADLAEGVAENLEATKERVTFLTAEQRALVEASLASAESIAALKTAADEASIGISSQFNYTKSLADELLRLADANGVVQEADKARAEFILGELNSALGTEYAMNGNIIGSYTNLKDGIYGVIEAKRAQILLQQYEEQYAEAVKNLAAQENARATQAIALSEAMTAADQARAEYEQTAEEARKSLLEDSSRTNATYWGNRLKVAEQSMKTQESLLDDAQKKYDETDAAVEGSLSAINSYEQASTAILQGETDKGIKILNNYGNGFTDAAGTASDANKKELESLQLKVINTSIELGKLEKNYKDNQLNMTKAEKEEAEKRIEAARKEAQDARTEFATVGGNMVEGLAKGAEDKDGNPTWNLAGKLRNIVRRALNAANEEADINSPAKETQYTGHMLIEGLALGIDERRSKAINAMKKTGAEVIQEMNKAVSAEIKELEKHSEEIEKAYEKRDKELQKKRNKSNGEKIDAQREALKEAYELEKKAVKDELELAKQRQKNTETLYKEYETYSKNMLKLEEDYASSVKKVKEKLADDIEAAEKRYTSAYNSRVASIKSGLRLFEEAEKGDAVKGRDLTKALVSQIDVLGDYNKALDDLSAKNVSTEFIEEMKGMGIDALPQLEAINKMTDDELAEYVKLWEEKNRLASEAATEELKGMREETDKEVVLLRENANKELEGLRQDYRDGLVELTKEMGLSMQGIGDAGIKALGVQVTVYAQAGKNLMDGVIDGIESEKDNVIASMVNNVMAAIEAAKQAAGIHSPSTVTRDELGKNLGLGVSEGWSDEVGNIQKTMSADLSGIVARVKATVNAENARYAHSTGVPDTGFSEIARAVGLQTAGINSLAGEFRRGTGTTRPIIIELDKRELGRTIIDVGGTEEVRIGAKLSLGGAK